MPRDAHLVVEEGAGTALPEHVSAQWMEAVGLHQSVRRRGLAVTAPAAAGRLVGMPGIRVLRPIGPRLYGKG